MGVFSMLRFTALAAVALASLSGVQAKSYPKESTPSVVASSSGLTVNGAAYHIHGIAYSPTPVGESTSYAPYGDYFTPDYAYIWSRDLPAIKAAGFNTVRIYSWNNSVDHSVFLDALQYFSLKAVVTYYVQPLTPVNGANPAWTKTQQDAVIADYAKSVAYYGDHPAILAWAFGNELNGPWLNIVQMFDVDTSNGQSACNWQTSSSSGGSCYNTNPDNAEGSACFTATTCMYTKFFGWLNNAGAAGKTYTTRPQTSTFADVDYFMTSAPATDRLARFAGKTADLLPNLDIVTVQIYRGSTFGSYFSDYRAQTAKPLLIGEYGADAYNDPCGWDQSTQPCQNYLGQTTGKYAGLGGASEANFVGCGTAGASCNVPGVDAQSTFDLGLTKEMLADSATQVLGGILMEWHDENWKNVGTQDTCTTPCEIPVGTSESDAADIIANCYTEKKANYIVGSPGCTYKSHITCSNHNAGYHDLCGYYLPSAPDSYVNEAWFGMNGVTDCGTADSDTGHRLSSLQPRKVLTDINNGVPPTLYSCSTLKKCWDCVASAWGTIENARAHIAPGIANGDCNSACGFGFSASSSTGTTGTAPTATTTKNNGTTTTTSTDGTTTVTTPDGTSTTTTPDGSTVTTTPSGQTTTTNPDGSQTTTTPGSSNSNSGSKSGAVATVRASVALVAALVATALLF